MQTGSLEELRAEWLVLVSRTQSAAGIVLILSSDINKGASLRKVRHTDTFLQVDEESSGCEADGNERGDI